jgi:hypothetical protein
VSGDSSSRVATLAMWFGDRQDFFWRNRPRSLREGRGQCPRHANRIGLPPRSRVLLRKRLRMRAEARFRPCSSPKAVSTGKCPLGLRLNSGAAVDPSKRCRVLRWCNTVSAFPCQTLASWAQSASVRVRDGPVGWDDGIRTPHLRIGALETDSLADAARFEPLHFEIRSTELHRGRTGSGPSVGRLSSADRGLAIPSCAISSAARCLWCLELGIA